MSKTESISFEKMIKDLQDINSKMSSGKLSLDEMLFEYEKGISIYRNCRNYLKDAELKIQEFEKEIIPGEIDYNEE